MSAKFLSLVFLGILGMGSFQSAARAEVIPNELGEPKAGGFPRETSNDHKILYGSVRVGSEIQRVIVNNPPGQGRKPVLLFVGGMGCYSLDFSGTGPKAEAYQQILDFATRLGFATMRVEKSGMGDSQGTPCEAQDFLREVAGNLAGLKALSSYSFVNPEELFIFGHSIGGVIAPLLAAKVPVKRIAVLGTLAESWYEYEIENVRRQYLLSGMNAFDVERAMVPQILARNEFYLNKKTPDQIAFDNPHLANVIYFPVHWTYMQQLAEVSPVRDWNKTSADVLILSGDSDFIGSQFSALTVMAAEANKTRANSIQVVRVPSLDHFFRVAFSQSESYQSRNSNGFPLLFQSSVLKVLETDFFLK